MQVILDIRMVVACEPRQAVSDLAERIQQAVQNELNEFTAQGAVFTMTETGHEVYVNAADVLMDPELNKESK